MSLIEKLATKVQAYQTELWRDRHPYVTAVPQVFGVKWVVKQGGEGCRPVNTQTRIAMDKNPPPLPDAQPKPATEKPAAIPLPAASATAPAASAPHAPAAGAVPTPQKTKEDDCPPLPEFDMLDLPEGMDSMGFKFGAYCERRWFNGKANVIPDPPDGIFDKAFVDANTFKLKWINSFGKVKDRYDHLLASDLKPSAEENIYNDKAKPKLIEKLQKYNAQNNHRFHGSLDTLAECGNDLQLLHQRFQFQMAKVEIYHVLGGITTVMNDLAASLANFYFYAAIANANFSYVEYMRYGTTPWKKCFYTKAEVTHVYVYAKDTYSFNDKTQTNVSQYLGHWNKQGVIIASDAAVTDRFSRSIGHELGNEPRQYLPPVPTHLDKPVDTGSKQRKAEVFFPVRNRDFRRWRELKGRGGDFLIFSNLERIKLPQPIVLDLGEMCWDYAR